MTDRTGTDDEAAEAGGPAAGERRRAKLARLAAVEGFDHVAGLLAAVWCDDVSPAIRVNPGCDHVAGMEPDQRRGYREARGTGTVQAAPVLAGLVR